MQRPQLYIEDRGHGRASRTTSPNNVCMKTSIKYNAPSNADVISTFTTDAEHSVANQPIPIPNSIAKPINQSLNAV